jgi:acetyl-CoA carboxylase biotin carboxyl carrier protein
LRISRMPSGNFATQQVLPMLPANIVGGQAGIAAPAESPAARPKNDEHVVTAPMVGTYYAAPSPGAKVFVNIGDEIKVGQVLCIIEAMKMMNQIESDKAGKLTSIMAQNGDPVEFGQPLFVIE